jgi:hypothetical protein
MQSSSSLSLSGAPRLANNIANVHMKKEGKEVLNTISIVFADYFFLFASEMKQAFAVDILKMQRK